MFCKKCEKLHYSRAFIEHGLLGHNTETVLGIPSPVLSSGKIIGTRVPGGNVLLNQ